VTQFEFLSAAASIVFALSIGRIISVLPHIFGEKKNLIAIAAVMTLFFWQLIVWWNLWNLNTVTDWNFIGFLLFIGTPLAYYLATHILVPANPETISSWQEHYTTRSRLFTGSFAFAMTVGALRIGYLEGFNSGQYIFGPILVSILCVGTLTTNRNAHGMIMLFIFIAGIFVI
jgi:hypothetical protein